MDTWSNVETKSAWLLLLEDWDRAEVFLSLAGRTAGPHSIARSLKRSFKNRYCRGRRHSTNLLCKLALNRVDFSQLAQRLIELIARRES
jgi:hypothetical protein